MSILLSHGGWGMPTVPIDIAVEHCARLGFDGYTMAVKPGWTTDAANLDVAERKRILALFDRYGLELAGISGQTSLLPETAEELAENLRLNHAYIDLTADLQRPGHLLPLCMTAGGRPEQWDAAKHLLVDRFGELARHAERVGVTNRAYANAQPKADVVNGSIAAWSRAQERMFVERYGERRRRIQPPAQQYDCRPPLRHSAPSRRRRLTRQRGTR